MKKPKGHAPFPSNARHDSHTPTLKRPLSMMSIILYCWLMSFSSTRFLSAFSWSFLLVSNSRLSERRGQEDATRRTKRPASNLLGHRWLFPSIHHWREDTDLQVGVVPRPVRVRVQAEGSGGQRQEHGAHAPHGQQRPAERRSPERARPEEKSVPHHRKKEENKQKNSLI